MPNDTVEAPSQAVEAAPPPETNSDAPKRSNLSVAEAAARLLNMESERADAKAAQMASQPAPAENNSASDSSAEPDAATTESAEVPVSEAPADEAGMDDVPSQDLPDDIKKKVAKRISTEFAKRKAVERELNDLKLQLTQLQQQQTQQPVQPPVIAPLPQGVTPLAQIEDVGQLQTLAQQAKEAKRFAQEQLDRDDFEPVRIGDEILDRQKLKTIVRNANKTLEDDIPQRVQFLQARNQAQQIAFEKFPFLRDRSTPEYVQAQQAYMAMPWLKNLPNADWIIGVQIEGLKALQAKEKKAGVKPTKAAPFSTKPPTGQSVVSSASGDVRTPSATRSQAQIESMRSALSRKGGVSQNEAAQFLLARELAKQNR
jgi:hypothetical protein